MGKAGFEPALLTQQIYSLPPSTTRPLSQKKSKIFMALALYGFMALWLYGFMALWLYGFSALWL